MNTFHRYACFHTSFTLFAYYYFYILILITSLLPFQLNFVQPNMHCSTRHICMPVYAKRWVLFCCFVFYIAFYEGFLPKYWFVFAISSFSSFSFYLLFFWWNITSFCLYFIVLVLLIFIITMSDLITFFFTCHIHSFMQTFELSEDCNSWSWGEG